MKKLPGNLHPQNESDGPSRVFRTSEEIAAAEKTRVSPEYLRLYDSLCAAALNTRRRPAQMGAILKIFPFIRLGAVFRVPLSNDWLGDWITAAFYAGFYYGNRFPEKAVELAEPALAGKNVNRLPALAQALDGQPATIENIGAVFNVLAGHLEPDFGQTVHQHWVSRLLEIECPFATLLETLADCLFDSDVRSNTRPSVQARRGHSADGFKTEG